MQGMQQQYSLFPFVFRDVYYAELFRSLSSQNCVTILQQNPKSNSDVTFYRLGILVKEIWSDSFASCAAETYLSKTFGLLWMDLTKTCLPETLCLASIFLHPSPMYSFLPLTFFSKRRHRFLNKITEYPPNFEHAVILTHKSLHINFKFSRQTFP